MSGTRRTGQALPEATESSGGRSMPAEASPLWHAATRLREAADTARTAEDSALGALLNDLLDAAAAMEQQLMDQRDRIDQLESLSITDELTGLLNRRGFHIEIDRALARARRADERGLLVVCDLDHFKSVNDRFGHLAGDEVLRAVARALVGCTRQSDYLARLGGDEFAVLMTDTQPQRALRLANKLSDRLNGLVVTWQNVEIPVSASLGGHPYSKEITAEHLRILADQAMYRRKHDGEDRTGGAARVYGLASGDGPALVRTAIEVSPSRR